MGREMGPEPPGVAVSDPETILPDSCEEATRNAFEMLKSKLIDAPLLRHFNPDIMPVIRVYASEWAIAGALAQEFDGKLMPVMYTSRVLNPFVANFWLGFFLFRPPYKIVKQR
jgi:hypothetical protein